MTIRIRALDHVVLRVGDLAKAIAFYRDVLGCKEERRIDSMQLVQMRAGAALIDLIARRSDETAAQPGNMDHFCVRLEPFDEAEIRAHLEKHDVEAGPTESRYGAEGDGPSIYIRDPDGNVVELKGPPSRPAA